MRNQIKGFAHGLIFVLVAPLVAFVAFNAPTFVSAKISGHDFRPLISVTVKHHTTTEKRTKMNNFNPAAHLDTSQVR